ncbi:MAG: MiaB/RimO family radical SAM methylthiotransferase [Gemmatimonadales bacterium]
MAYLIRSHDTAVTKVYFHTFGCKTNQYDTELVKQMLEDSGAMSVDDPSEADAAVINSCTVTHAGEAKMRAMVRRLARGSENIRTVVMGCAAALDEGVIGELPGVVGVVGGADPHGVLQALGFQSRAADLGLRRFARGGRAWLKIQDGCDEHCTFCATTAARGANRSRPIEALVREAETLAVNHREIVLTGVHIGAYGVDWDRPSSLSLLVEALVLRVPGARFRLSSIEATEIDDRLAAIMTDAPHRLVPHIHAPLQSGSDRVLRRMGRHWYTSDSYYRRLDRLASRLPRLGLGADVIVGFPGEDDGDFAQTVAIVNALPFTYLHVFPYSERPTAAAQRLGPPVEPRTARRRSGILRRLVDAKSHAYRQSRNGGTADLVVLSRNRGRYDALTEDYLSVGITTDTILPGRLQARLQLDGDDLWAIPLAA